MGVRWKADKRRENKTQLIVLANLLVIKRAGGASGRGEVPGIDTVAQRNGKFRAAAGDTGASRFAGAEAQLAAATTAHRSGGLVIQLERSGEGVTCLAQLAHLRGGLVRADDQLLRIVTGAAASSRGH